MKIKVGQKVVCRRGKFKGTSGTVLKVARRNDRSGSPIKVIRVDFITGKRASKGSEGSEGGVLEFNPFVPACNFRVLEG